MLRSNFFKPFWATASGPAQPLGSSKGLRFESTTVRRGFMLHAPQKALATRPLPSTPLPILKLNAMLLKGSRGAGGDRDARSDVHGRKRYENTSNRRVFAELGAHTRAPCTAVVSDEEVSGDRAPVDSNEDLIVGPHDMQNQNPYEPFESHPEYTWHQGRTRRAETWRAVSTTWSSSTTSPCLRPTSWLTSTVARWVTVFMLIRHTREHRAIYSHLHTQTRICVLKRWSAPACPPLGPAPGVTPPCRRAAMESSTGPRQASTAEGLTARPVRAITSCCRVRRALMLS